jgi:hypothetical protein
VQWALVRNQTPPIVPQLTSEGDHSCFPSLNENDDSKTVFKDGEISVDILTSPDPHLHHHHFTHGHGRLPAPSLGKTSEEYVVDDIQACEREVSNGDDDDVITEKDRVISDLKGVGVAASAGSLGDVTSNKQAEGGKNTSDDAPVATKAAKPLVTAPPPLLAIPPTLDRSKTAPPTSSSGNGSSGNVGVGEASGAKDNDNGTLFGNFHRFTRDVDPHWATPTSASPSRVMQRAVTDSLPVKVSGSEG